MARIAKTQTKAKKTRRKPEPKIPTTFQPLFWQKADSRLAIVREIRGRYEALRSDTGAESVQKDLLCQRATFLVVWLETQERRAIEEGMFDPGLYTQAVNSLLGLLRTLGLDKARKHVQPLKAYVKGRGS